MSWKSRRNSLAGEGAEAAAEGLPLAEEADRLVRVHLATAPDGTVKAPAEEVDVATRVGDGLDRSCETAAERHPLRPRIRRRVDGVMSLLLVPDALLRTTAVDGEKRVDVHLHAGSRREEATERFPRRPHETPFVVDRLARVPEGLVAPAHNHLNEVLGVELRDNRCRRGQVDRVSKGRPASPRQRAIFLQLLGHVIQLTVDAAREKVHNAFGVDDGLRRRRDDAAKSGPLSPHSLGAVRKLTLLPDGGVLVAGEDVDQTLRVDNSRDTGREDTATKRRPPIRGAVGVEHIILDLLVHIATKDNNVVVGVADHRRTTSEETPDALPFAHGAVGCILLAGPELIVVAPCENRPM